RFRIPHHGPAAARRGAVRPGAPPGVLRAPDTPHPACRAGGAERLRGGHAAPRAARRVAAVPPAGALQRPVRGELAPRARLADPGGGRPRVDARAALLVALG